MREAQQLDGGGEKFGAFAHGDEAHAGFGLGRCRGGVGVKALAVVFDFELQRIGLKTEADPGFAGAGMAGDVVESFLEDAIDVDGGAGVHGIRVAGFFVGDVNAGLFFDDGNVPVNGAFEAGFIEHHGMQGLREAANIFESGLGDVANFVKLGAQRGIGGSVAFDAAEHGADGGEDLAELVVEFAGNVAESRFLCGD